MKKLLCVFLMGAFMLTGCTQKVTTEEGKDTINDVQNEQSEETNDKLEAEFQAYKDKLLEVSDYIPQLEEVKAGDQIAVMTTNMGEIKIKLCPKEAPKAVENFIGLAEKGYYDGLTFHRVIDEFMIQGGDPNGNGTGGESIWGEPFADEFSPVLYHFRGALAMANSGPDTNGSQFYIVQNKTVDEEYFKAVDQANEEYGEDTLITIQNTNKIYRRNYHQDARDNYLNLGGVPQLDYGYTVFGQVYEGMDVVDKIATVEKDSSDKPVEDVIIDKVEIQTVE